MVEPRRIDSWRPMVIATIHARPVIMGASDIDVVNISDAV